MEQHDAARRREIRDFDRLHHGRLCLPDGSSALYIHCQQFSAIRPSERQQTEITEKKEKRKRKRKQPRLCRSNE